MFIWKMKLKNPIIRRINKITNPQTICPEKHFTWYIIRKFLYHSTLVSPSYISLLLGLCWFHYVHMWDTWLGTMSFKKNWQIIASHAQKNWIMFSSMIALVLDIISNCKVFLFLLQNNIIDQTNIISVKTKKNSPIQPVSKPFNFFSFFFPHFSFPLPLCYLDCWNQLHSKVHSLVPFYNLFSKYFFLVISILL